MMKKLLTAFVLLLSTNFFLFAQQDKPKLVVLIVCDQLSQDLLLRYQPYFGENGFNLLMQRGAYFTNARYKYAFTKTGPGHATISTGSYGDMSGIVGNSWYDRTIKKTVNCVEDTAFHAIGGKGDHRSPRTLLTNSLTDMLKLSTNFRSKVISVSNKDRSAIFMGGKFGTAYWEGSHAFLTSTYYMNTLPEWVEAYNKSKIFDSFFGKRWEELKPEIAQVICDTDSNTYESNNSGNGLTFPHTIVGKDRVLNTSYYDAVGNSPFGTELLLDFARTAVLAESLGQHRDPDMLCIGISSTDEVGHEYGPHSREAFDNLLRTDAYLAEFFAFLDKHVGLYNCVIALSADHGIAPIPEYITKMNSKADAGRISTKKIKEAAERFLTNSYGAITTKWVEEVAENNIFINKDAAKEKNVPFESVLQTLKDSMSVSLPVFASFTREDIMRHAPPEKIRAQIALSYHPARSGDIMYVLNPYWILDGSPTGTNHGSPWDYDAHVPIMLFGKDVTPGTYTDDVAPVDIAPTLAALLGIEFPPSREGKVLGMVVK